MKVKITKRKNFPKCIRKFKELKGICIGECVNKNSSIDKNHSAHAHSWSKPKGWICLRYKYQLKEKLTLLHEVAHLIANSPGTLPHGKEWKKAVKDIGGTFKSYKYTHNGHVYEYLDFTYRNRRQ